jgi:hypothetical protein
VAASKCKDAWMKGTRIADEKKRSLEQDLESKQTATWETARSRLEVRERQQRSVSYHRSIGRFDCRPRPEILGLRIHNPARMRTNASWSARSLPGMFMLLIVGRKRRHEMFFSEQND